MKQRGVGGLDEVDAVDHVALLPGGHIIEAALCPPQTQEFARGLWPVIGGHKAIIARDQLSVGAEFPAAPGGREQDRLDQGKAADAIRHLLRQAQCQRGAETVAYGVKASFGQMRKGRLVALVMQVPGQVDVNGLAMPRDIRRDRMNPGSERAHHTLPRAGMGQ